MSSPYVAPSSGPVPAAGWYADPQDPTSMRYWDGSTWTDHRVPRTPSSYTQPAQPYAAPPYGGPPYGASPYGAPPYGGAPPFPAAPTHGPATTSLVLGIVSLVLCGLFTGIPAMIIGRRAAREIDASGGTLGGRGLATAGFVTGLVGTILSGLSIVIIVLAVAVGGTTTSGSGSGCTQVNSSGASAPCP